jgi:hypothetical protein
LKHLVDHDHSSNTKTYTPSSFNKEWLSLLIQVQEYPLENSEDLDVEDLVLESAEDLCEKAIKQVNNNPFSNLEEVCSKVKIPDLDVASDLEVIKLTKTMQ